MIDGNTLIREVFKAQLKVIAGWVIAYGLFIALIFLFHDQIRSLIQGHEMEVSGGLYFGALAIVVMMSMFPGDSRVGDLKHQMMATNSIRHADSESYKYRADSSLELIAKLRILKLELEAKGMDHSVLCEAIDKELDRLKNKYMESIK